MTLVLVIGRRPGTDLIVGVAYQDTEPLGATEHMDASGQNSWGAVAAWGVGFKPETAQSPQHTDGRCQPGLE